MNKLGVIQLIDSLNTGGAEVLAVNIANTLSDKSINSHLCSTRLEGKLKNNLNKNIKYIFLKKKKILDVKALILLKKYIIENKISIIHAHSSSFFFAFCLKIILPKIKIFWHIHLGNLVQTKENKILLFKFISLFFEGIIVVSEDLKDWALNNLWCKKVFFINNFPDFATSDKVTFLKGKQSNKIIHLAGFREVKDHFTLIKAFSIFSEKNIKWSLHLVGQINNDEYSKKILELIKLKSLENSIFTYDSCVDIKHVLSQASIGVLSSKSEGLPISLLEYGLAKLPAIVTDVGECAKVIQNNKSGLVVSPENFIELENALSELANSKDKRKRFGEKHYNNVKEYYSKEKFISQLITIYTN